MQANQIKSNQLYLLYSQKSQSHCLRGLYNLYSERSVLRPRFKWGKTFEKKKRKKKTFNRENKKIKKMEEISGRATEEGSLSQDGQTCNRCRQYRKQQNHSLQVALRKYLIQTIIFVKCVWLQVTAEQAETSPCGAWATRPPLHRGDLGEGRPYKMISGDTERIRLKRRRVLATEVTHPSSWLHPEFHDKAEPRQECIILDNFRLMLSWSF